MTLLVLFVEMVSVLFGGETVAKLRCMAGLERELLANERVRVLPLLYFLAVGQARSVESES